MTTLNLCLEFEQYPEKRLLFSQFFVIRSKIIWDTKVVWASSHYRQSPRLRMEIEASVATLFLPDPAPTWNQKSVAAVVQQLNRI